MKYLMTGNQNNVEVFKGVSATIARHGCVI